jgi:membrane protein
MSHVHDPQRAQEPKHAQALADPLTEPQDASLGTLVSQLSSQIPELIRSEMRLAQAEVAEKGKRAGIGFGMFSVAGLMGFFGFAVLLAALVLLLDLVLPAWAAALIVAAVLFVIAAVAGLVGRKKVAEVGSPTPELAMSGIKKDVATVKGERR